VTRAGGARLPRSVPSTVWEAVFMLLILKIPIVYLGTVVWWAVRAEPTPEGGGDEVGVTVPLTPCGWDEWRRTRPRRPRPGPLPRSGRPARPAKAFAR
jgi:hypothetical protein